MTIKECQEKHKALWNWIADETERTGKLVQKEAYFVEKEISNLPEFDCYACQFGIEKTEQLNLNKCQGCPISWEKIYGKPRVFGKSKCCCVHNKNESAYRQLVECWFATLISGNAPSRVVKKCAELAREVANYPFVSEKELEVLLLNKEHEEEEDEV